MLTLQIADTFNHIIENGQKPQPQKQSATSDEKGYFIAYENQEVNEYIIKKALGQGSFGRVMLAEKNGKKYALKICRNQPYFIDAMKQEIIIYKMIENRCPGMAAALFEDFEHSKHLCYSMELYDLTLYQQLKQTQQVGFGLPIVRQIARMLGNWLSTMEDLKIVHTDMKPENMVMYQSDISSLRLIDYGSAVLMEEGVRPTYIQSRFYRAPEITFGVKYDYKIDCWSVGALLLELHTCYTVFPAKSSYMLMKMFISLLGMPPAKLVYDENGAVRQKVEKYFVKPTETYWVQWGSKMTEYGVSQDSVAYLTQETIECEDRDQCRRRSIDRLIRNIRWAGREGHTEQDYTQFLQVIRGLLQWEGEKRMSGKELLQSDFCKFM